MEKAPLIVRNQWKLPVYPKLQYISGKNTFYKHGSMDTTTPNSPHDREMNESKEGLVTETQMQIITSHVDRIEADRVLERLKNKESPRLSQQESAYELLTPEHGGSLQHLHP
jgi:hypothetical protein